MKRTKVLHLTSTRYGIGGVERLLLDMSDKYDAGRFDVSYCNLFSELGVAGAFPTELRARGLTYFHIPGKRWYEIPGILLRLIRLLNREKFDVVHLHMLQSTILGGIAARFQAGGKVIVTKHYTNELAQHHPRILSDLDRYFTRTADRVVAISDSVRSDMIGSGTPSSLITVIHNGTDIEKFDQRAKEPIAVAYSRAGGTILLGTVGSLTKRKGHKFLFQVFAEILQSNPGCRLLVIGEGPEFPALKKLRDELGLGESIDLVGFTANVAPILRELDLYIHPAAQEPFGIAILEAMAARKCVVATAVDGVPEIVEDGRTGYLITHGDVLNSAKLILDLLKDPDLCGATGRRARIEVENRFAISQTITKYESLYLDL